MNDAYICLKHGQYHAPMEFTAIECPHCHLERQNVAVSGAENRRRAQATLSPEQSAEKAVIEAVEQWMLAAGDAHKGRCRNREGMGCYLCDISQAYRALRASRQPQPVRPEEVEPGTRFRFVDRPTNQGEYVLVVQGMTHHWLDERSSVRPFSDDARIIPIQD